MHIVLAIIQRMCFLNWLLKSLRHLFHLFNSFVFVSDFLSELGDSGFLIIYRWLDICHLLLIHPYLSLVASIESWLNLDKIFIPLIARPWKNWHLLLSHGYAESLWQIRNPFPFTRRTPEWNLTLLQIHWTNLSKKWECLIVKQSKNWLQKCLLLLHSTQEYSAFR